MKRSLFDLTGEYLGILDALENNADDEELQVLCDQITDDFGTKADNYAFIIGEYASSVDAIDKEIERLNSRKESFNKSIDRLKNNLQTSMEVTGNTKLKTALHTFSVATAGGKAPLKLDVSIDELPDDLIITKVEKKPNNDLIRKMIDEDGDLTYGHYEPRKKYLRIK